MAGRECPNCSSSGEGERSFFDRTMVKMLGGALGGGAIAFTLMACYGAPPCDEPECRAVDDPDASASTDSGRDANRPDVSVTRPNEAGTAADGSTEAGLDDGGDGGDGG